MGKAKANTKSDMNEKLSFHNYAACVASGIDSLDTTSAGGSGTRRTPTISPPTLTLAKKPALKTKPSLANVLAAIKSVDNKVEVFGQQLKTNSEMLARIARQVDLNVIKCNSKVEGLEKEFAELKEENAEPKERILETERYKRRWNLRLSGLKDQEGENLREIIEELLLELLPNWEEQIANVVDVGRKERGRNRQIIIQFVRRRHRDQVWKTSKDSVVCRDRGLRFMQDFTKEDQQAREQLWPQVKQARSLGKVAFYRGHIAIIDVRIVTA